MAQQLVAPNLEMTSRMQQLNYCLPHDVLEPFHSQALGDLLEDTWRDVDKYGLVSRSGPAPELTNNLTCVRRYVDYEL